MAFTIDKIRRISQYAAADKPASENHGIEVKKGDILWTIKDVTDFTISNSSEAVEATDGEGVVIERYLRSKAAEASGSNALFDMPLAAAQAGTKVTTGAVDIDFHDVLKMEKDATELTLSKTPKTGGEPEVVYICNDDGSLGEKLEVGAGKTVTYADGKLTFTATPAAEKVVNVFVPYTYTQENAQKFTNFTDADAIPGRCVVEGIGRDVCSHALCYFYVIAPYAKLSLDGDLNLGTPDATHDFTINFMREYCGEEGLYTIITC
jgi:hypothetical protein